MTTPARELQFNVGMSVARVSALLVEPQDPRCLYVLAHGAGAGMRHPFLERVAQELADRSIATFRYQFPYMEAGEPRTDSPPVIEATVVAAVNAAADTLPGPPLIAGGKSFGGRMTSYTASDKWLPGVRGLVFLGFPLHAPRRPAIKRAEHLDQVQMPLLFLQGTRDEFAQLDLIRGVCERLGPRARLHVVEGADHSFKVLKRSGRTESEVMAELADTIRDWATTLLRIPRAPRPV